MNKGPTTSVTKTSAPLPRQSAWAKGPPQATPTSSASSPRPQSPAPAASQAQSQSHSRRSSQLGSFKDAVGVGIASGTRGNVPPTKSNPINFGTVNGAVNEKAATTPSSSPAPAPPLTKSESRPVQSFGSIEATQSGMSTSSKPSPTPASSSSSAAPATSSATTTADSTRATTPHKPTKVDVSALFRGGGGSGKTSSPVNASFPPESVASPPMRSSTLSPAVPPPQSQNGSGPAGPGPHHHVHPHQQPPQSYPQPFVPASMRNQNIGNGPRSPSFQRAMPNGAGGRPPGGGGPPGPNGNNMPSPRLAPPLHMQHQHQQQPPVQGMPPQMPGMHGWSGSYYPYMPSMPMQGVPGAEHYMQYSPQAWYMHPPPQHQLPHQGPSGANGPPQTPLTHSHGLPMSSPRQPPPPLQAPATPPTGISTPLPSAGPGVRLNTNANAFVPSQGGQPSVQRSKVKITDPQGHELDLHGLTKQSGTPISSTTPAPPTPASDKNVPRSVRIESPEVRSKRLAQEERERKAKEELERKKREEKEAEEQKKREQKEAEERQRREDEEKKKAEEEEKARIEEERKQKEEERRRKEEEEKERVKLEEEERKRKEEEMRLRKEEDEKERLRMEEEERRRKEEEEERQRKEAEEKERLQKEEEAKAKAAAETAAAAEAEKAKAAPLEIKSKKEGDAASSVTGIPLSTSPETAKKRPIPGPLDLSSTHKSVAQPLPSALATARHIQDVYQVQYPEGIKSPKPELNTNAKDGKFRYDRDFLLQFMSVCKEKPDNLPSLEAIGLEPVDQSHPIGRGGSGRRGVSGSMGPPSSTSRQASVGLGLGLSNGFGGKTGSGFAMGNFATSNKLSSDERFMRSSSMSGGPGGMPYGAGRPAPMVRSSSQGGPGARGSGRTRSKRGDSTRNESNRVNAASSQFNSNMSTPLEPVAPLEQSANRWVAGTFKRGSQVDMDSPEVVDKKVRSLLNKLTMEKFESISNQIIEWANKSEREKDGRTLIQVIRLVFEKATDEAAWSEMYARLCRKMMEQISPNVQDDGIRNAEGKPITGGLLFRKYLLNRCQEDFERGWSQKESTAAAALVKATEDQAIQAANEKKEAGEVDTFSEEYYAAQKAKRQGLGLIKFIGELFKLQMLTERIMHECIKKLLSNVDNPEEEEIESLCKLLSTVGQALDTSKARGHMDVYFSRMTELARSSNVSSRMQFMLQDVIELRARKWIPRNASAAPSTIAQIHEAAAKEKAQQDQHNLARTAISRGGSRRGHDRDGNAQVGPDGWAVASGPSRPANKAGDLTNFGKIQKGSGGLNFGPASVFTKKGDNKRDSASLSRASSSTNMFQMLQGAEAAGESLPVSSTRPSRPSSRTTSVDLTNSALSEPLQPAQRPRLNLLPRSKPLATDKSEASPAEGQEDEEGEEGEIVERDAGKSSMSKEQAEKKVDQDRKEFFAIRDLEEAEEYFSALPSEHRHILVEKLVMSALEAKEADAKLVADLFERAISRNLCSPAAFEDGFMPAADVLDDIAIDAPKAFNLMAMMMKGAKLDEERRTRIASKSMDSDKLLGLLS